MRPGRLRIVVLGYIVRGPYGGLAWHHLQYVMSLAALGHEVYFFEDSGDYPACCNPETGIIDTDPAYGLAFAARAFESVGAPNTWAYYDAHQSVWRGPLSTSAERIAQSADIVLNISAVNPVRSWFERVPIRVLVDSDPAFVQIRHLVDPGARALAQQHNNFFTFGENVNGEGCAIPGDGFEWKTTRQPIALDAWSTVPGNPTARFTTVMQWDSYPPREYGGRSFGMKSASFPPYMDLPQRTDAELELALGSGPAPRNDLQRRGWFITDPTVIARDTRSYQSYISGSAAEFSVAKHGYVSSNSGWFSERSAAYLASGRPVVTQNTGFSTWLPTGCGVLAFDNADQALGAIEEVRCRYDAHSRAARELAEEYFDGRKVLARLLEEVHA
jgi:hypothetical protein